jgi:phosphoesterase RecJ-like protein
MMAPRGPDWTETMSILKNHHRFWVTSHIDTDGDALASVLSLGTALKELGKSVRMVIDSEVPDVYRSLPFLDELESPSLLDGSSPPEVVIVLDAPNLDRTGCVRGRLEGSEILVNIDHHAGNERFGSVNVVEESAPAVAFMVHELLKSMAPSTLDAERSGCLYVGLLGDTGGFRFPNTNLQAFRMALEVVERGVDVSELAHRYLDGWPPGTLRLLALTLDTLKVLEEGLVATIEVRRSMLDATGTQFKDSEGFVNFVSSIPGVVLAALLKESDDSSTKVSLRSRGELDVAALAGAFGGGGHRNAAGCRVPAGVERARELILEAARPHLKGGRTP